MPRMQGRSGPFLTLVLRVTLGALLTLLTAAAAAEAQTLAGRVLDPDSRPVAGADVLIVRGNQVVATAKTSADGRFGAIAVEPGEYEIVASAPGLRSPSTPASVQAGAETSIDLKLAVTAIHESIVVSATQVEQPLTRATDSVTVITRAEIDAKQIETVPDALRAVPGLTVVASGGRGAVTSLFPRGGESDYTLVLVDGVAQNSFGGFIDFAHFGTGEVERIEVVRGPQSALYGGGAIGAIVHVITPHGGPTRAAASYESGGNATHRATASVVGRQAAWRWGLSLDGVMTDGDTRLLSNGTRVANDDYERATGSVSLGWSGDRGRQMRVDARVGRTERGFPGPFGSDPLGLYQGVDLVSRGMNDFTSLAGTGTFRTGTLTHRGRVTWSSAESDSISPFGPFEDRTSRTTGRYQLDTTVRRIDLSAGWEFVHEAAESTFVIGEQGQRVPVRRSVSGWFVEGRPNLGRRAFLNVGARVERIEREALEADPLSFSPRPALEEDVVWSVNPKVSAAWFVNPPEGDTWTKIRAGAGTGIKPPTTFDIAFTDNPGLKPERSRSLDVGVEHGMAASTLIAEATFFANRYDDLIVTVSGAFAGSSRYRTDNIANARARGLEVGARWHPIDAVALRTAWTWLDTEILGVDGATSEAPFPYQVGDQLIRRPRHQVSFEAGWSHARGSAFVLLNGRGTVRDIEPNFAAEVFDNPGYVTVAVGGALRLTRNVELFTRVTNLFDREYEEAYGFPALGRMGMIGLRVTGHR
jgi:outer membrane cobalamin receptor